MLRTVCFLFLIASCPYVVAQSSSALPSSASTADQAFTQLLHDDWEAGLKASPTFATDTGDLRYNDQLGDTSIAAQKRRIAEDKSRQQQLDKIDRESLSAENRVHYDIFRHMLADRVREAEFESYLMPITNRWGFHIWFPELAKKVPLDTVKHYEDYIARLRAFDGYTDQQIALMRTGIEKGLVLPAVVLQTASDTIKPHIVDDIERSLLYAPFRKMPPRFSAAEQQQIDTAGREAIRESVVPAYERFLKFMQEEYIPACRGSIGISAIPNGRAYYRHRVRKFTTLDITPEEVHKIGLNEVKRIRGEMHDIMKRVKFKGDFAAFCEHLRTDPKFYAKTSRELKAEVSLILKRMDGELPNLFKTLPRTPYGVREVPAYVAPQTTAAYYQRPAGDGSRAGFYFLNTYDLKSRPLYGLEALSLHEAVPGHHLQIALQQELALPNFRRFSGFTVFVEGWALYSERLGLEVGFYEDPYSDFGRLTYEMWRACRLVVDTGMHYFGWTRQQAIDFMQENSALSLHNITAEVDRYISWPGQALAYKMGELKIRELRAEAEQKLGDKFDVREFHEVVLGSGAVPLFVLERNVRDYIQRADD